ncbi:MAG: ATP-binding protein [Flavobacteriales bacterium]|nr:ATP-binding protein [Flavobacteriales bacterium]
MKAPKNPFLLLGYHSKEYFCDRESELEKLAEHIDNERNVMLYAWRRMGKSALIKQFLQEAEKEKKLEAIYVDLVATNSIEQANELLIKAVYERFGKTSTGFSSAFQKLIGSLGVILTFDPTTGFPAFEIGASSIAKSQESLNSIGKFLQNRKTTVVIAIDEFQQITKFKEPGAEGMFRTFMQSYPGIRFIFSGSHRQMMTSMFLEKNRPFYRSCQLISLDAIPLELYTPFIQNHFQAAEKTISAELIAEIYSWCKGQTYAVQLVCNLLFGTNEPLNTEVLRIIKSEILQQDAPLFAAYANLMSQTQWNVLKAIAKEGLVTNPMSREFGSKHKLGAASTVNSALKMLVEKEIVVANDEGYFVHETLFGNWLATL